MDALIWRTEKAKNNELKGFLNVHDLPPEEQAKYIKRASASDLFKYMVR